MWYFSWILGVGLACTFAILNAMWFEMREDRRIAREERRSPIQR
jgi:cyd operon protein YbgT